MVYNKVSKNRYNYYKNYIKYAVATKSNNEIKKNKDRYLYYNKYLYYLNQNTKIEKLDLSSKSLYINQDISIEKKIKTNTQATNTVSLFNNIEKTYSNRFNVLDLLLPNINKNLVDHPLENNTIIDKPLVLEHNDEEKLYEFKILDENIDDIKDLIILAKLYKTKYIFEKKRYNLNLRVLSEMLEPLQELDKMIGMENIKEAIFEKIILFLQGLDNANKDYQHIVLSGGPGMGKTEVAKLIGKIYAKMGILSKGDFKEIKLTDLKGGFVGQSELKTQKILDDAKGSVLFLDEAYSLGSEEKFDTYSQSIIDLINPFLDSNKNDFILIIAGYKNDLEKRFFRGNQGLKSRFGLWLDLKPYTSIDMKNIFIKKINDYEWKIKETIIEDNFFEKNKEFFKFYGRDIENLFAKCKIAHAKRVLFCRPEEKKNIILKDIINGLEIYKKQSVNNTGNTNKLLLESMYT